MREETKLQVRALYAKTSRFSGAVIAIVAAWFAVLLVMRLLAKEPFGEELMMMIFAGLMAAVLRGAHAEDPKKSESQTFD